MVLDEDVDVAVFNVNGQIYAIDVSCPHAGPSQFSSKLDGLTVRCAEHGMRFDLATGEMVSGGSCARSYPVEREGDALFVILPDAVPG